MFIVYHFFRLVDSPLEKELMERFANGSITAQEAILNGLDSSKVLNLIIA